MESKYIVLGISLIVILSYFFIVISRITRVPSVLLLLIAGILFRQFGLLDFVPENALNQTVEILGIIGLIMIILEAALDLHITRDKLSLIKDAFISALVILMISSFAIGYLIHYWLQEPFINSLIYATPLAVVSSAIVLPSVDILSEENKEFMIYEASFSDILGILFFNYLIGVETFNAGNALLYIGQMGLSAVLSIGVALFLIYILGKTKTTIKYFLFFGVLIGLYAVGKIIHLPSLLIILFFGLIINNRDLLKNNWWIDSHIPKKEIFKDLENQLKTLTAEASFIIRTFFFILFGYSINLQVLLNKEVAIIGSLIIVILLIVRLAFLKYLNPKENPLPELFLMPRGLITVLLFFSIPMQYKLQSFNVGILFFVILGTSILMMIGLFTVNKNVVDEVESSYGTHVH